MHVSDAVRKFCNCQIRLIRVKVKDASVKGFRYIRHMLYDHQSLCITCVLCEAGWSLWSVYFCPLSCFHCFLFLLSQRLQVRFLHSSLESPPSCGVGGVDLSGNFNMCPSFLISLYLSWTEKCMITNYVRFGSSDEKAL